MSDEISQKDIAEAMDRIARTPDGELLYLHLQKVCMGVLPRDADLCALPVQEGRRRFAHDLMAFMAEGIRTSARSGARPVTFAVASASSGASPGRSSFRGAGRRVTLADSVPGFDTPTESEPGRE